MEDEPRRISTNNVPVGSVGAFSGLLDTTDRDGNIVSRGAVSYHGLFSWSSSGASVALHDVTLTSNDGHTYVVDSVHWEGGPSGLVNRGPGGTLGAWSWAPDPLAWLVNQGGPIGPSPAVRVHFYDQNRPAVGGHLEQLASP